MVALRRARRPRQDTTRVVVSSRVGCRERTAGRGSSAHATPATGYHEGRGIMTCRRLRGDGTIDRIPRGRGIIACRVSRRKRRGLSRSQSEPSESGVATAGSGSGRTKSGVASTRSIAASPLATTCGSEHVARTFSLVATLREGESRPIKRGLSLRVVPDVVALDRTIALFGPERVRLVRTKQAEPNTLGGPGTPACERWPRFTDCCESIRRCGMASATPLRPWLPKASRVIRSTSIRKSPEALSGRARRALRSEQKRASIGCSGSSKDRPRPQSNRPRANRDRVARRWREEGADMMGGGYDKRPRNRGLGPTRDAQSTKKTDRTGTRKGYVRPVVPACGGVTQSD